MWVILLEAGVALALLLIIVWATWPKRRKTRDDNGNEND
jgi:cbb3-type cytochrome oxidase subunit 3